MKRLVPLILITIGFFGLVSFSAWQINKDYAATHPDTIDTSDDTLQLFSGAKNLTQQECCTLSRLRMKKDDELEVNITLKNIRQTTLPQVKVAYNLNSYFAPEPNTTKLTSGTSTNEVPNDTTLYSSGVNLGDMATNETKTITTKIKVVSTPKPEEEQKENTLTIYSEGQKYATADTAYPQFAQSNEQALSYMYLPLTVKSVSREAYVRTLLGPLERRDHDNSTLLLVGSIVLFVLGSIYLALIFGPVVYAAAEQIWALIIVLAMTAVALYGSSQGTGYYDGLMGLMALVILGLAFGAVAMMFIFINTLVADRGWLASRKQKLTQP